jgi:predicted Zn-dependent peptidase
VVIEEYNQRYRNQPYGDQGLLLRDMVYRVHPYRWPTFGLSPEQIRDARVADVKALYGRCYNPVNAILSVASEVEPEVIFELAEKWFGAIEGGERPVDTIPAEPTQTTVRRLEVERDVPATALTIAFPMGARISRNYYACDILSDVLAGGSSARLYQSLVKDSRLLSSVNAYITGDLDPGMFVVTGQLLPQTSVEAAEEAMWGELRKLASEPVGDYELEKVKNKFEAETTFGELNVMNKAMNLGFYAMLDDLPLINKEVAIYRSFTATELLAEASAMFIPERSSTLIYKAKK